MRQLILSFLLAFSIFSTKAQNKVTDSSVTCVAYWNKGDTKEFTITVNSRKIEKGKPKANSSLSYEARIKIIDSTVEGYTIEWANKYIKPLISDLETDALTRLFSELKFVYKTDDVGSFASLVNYREIQKFINESFEVIRKNATDKAVYDTVMNRIKPIFESRESVEQLILRDVNLYHAAFGAEYIFGKKQQYQTELPNFLGGEPIPAILTLYLIKKDEKTDIATIAFDMEIDQKNGAQLIKDIIAKFAPADAKINPEDLPSYLIINDHSEFELIISTGWLKRAYYKRMAKAGDSEKIETYEILMK